MPARNQDDPKRQALSRSGTLHPHPERITDTLFLDSEFFDPRDGVQVKYEMLRRVREEGMSVSRASAAFGLSRPTFYGARSAFEREGLVGLLPEKKGPRRAHKLSPEVLAFIDAVRAAEPGLKPADLAGRVLERLGVQVHPKSISRAQARLEKKQRPANRPERPFAPLLCSGVPTPRGGGVFA